MTLTLYMSKRFENTIMFKFKHILLPKYLQQWGWVTSSHNISFDPSPTFYIYAIAYKRG